MALQQGSPGAVSASNAACAFQRVRGLKGDPLFDLPVEKSAQRFEIVTHGGGGEITRTNRMAWSGSMM